VFRVEELKGANQSMPIRQAHDQKPFGPEFIEGQPTPKLFASRPPARVQPQCSMTNKPSRQSRLALTWISSKLPASLARFTSSRSRTVFSKTESPASLGTLAVLGTSRRKVRSLRTAPAVLRSR
jgi:hypothetical protein